MSEGNVRAPAASSLVVLDTGTDAELDDLAALAARVFDVPGAVISLVASRCQWFTASVGAVGAETARGLAFCDHTILQSGVLLVEDATQDPRFSWHWSVIGERHIRFYAGAPLVTADGKTVGAVCVFDYRARTASPYQQAMLLTLADQVARQVELRAARANPVPDDAVRPVAGASGSASPDPGPHDWVHLTHLKRLVIDGHVGYLEVTVEGVIQGVNRATCRMFGYSEEELVGTSARRLAHPEHSMDTEAAIADLVSGRRSFYDATRVYRHRTGRKVQVGVTVSYIQATAIRPAGMATLLVDLSAQVTADTFRVVAERDRRHVLDTATDAFISIDDQGTIRDWNPAAERLFGYPAGDAIGSNLTTINVFPDLAEARNQAEARAASGEEPTQFGRSREVLGRHMSGAELSIERTAWSTPLQSGRLQYHAFCRDISDRVSSRAALTEANRQLHEGRELLKAAFEASPTGDAVIDDRGRFLEVNAAMCRFLGEPPANLIGRRWAEFVYGPDWGRADGALTEILAADRPVHAREMRCVTASGQVVWCLVSLLPMASGGSGRQIMLRVADIQAHKELERTLARQASHDAISGLPNRSLFLERVRQALAPGGDGGSPVGVMVIEVDGLHPIIDREGYAAGDRVLALLADRMGDGLGDGVTLAHIRPGLFGAVVPDGVQETARVSQQILAAVRGAAEAPGGAVSLRASIGISVALPGHSDSASQIGRVVQDAESAARLANAEGGDRAVFAAPEMREAQQRQHALERLIREHLANDTITVVYQPVFELASGQVVAAEALLRISDRDGHPIPPLHVVPVAEASGLIVDIGRRVLQRAARQAAQWRADDGVLIPVAVNVSAVQLSWAGFPDDVLAAINAAGVPPEALTLELTESVLLKAGSSGIEQLRELRDAGIELAIDDFGTGYASLTYLRDLPASTLKIDRSFVAGIPDDPGAMAIVSGVIGLADNFGMTCIAEGIETEAQRDYLAARGVMGQGYLLGRPDLASAMSEILRHGPGR